jgi:hypothetical protein
MLILDNLGLSVASGTSVYDSVIKAWKAALLFVEDIIIGMPQTVQSAAVLLALSAWHLYPDMAVLCGHTRNIKQNDHLICPGGIVTIGLHKSIPDNDLGISWSLPLSHLRYYGEPTQATRSVGTQSSRISMEELLLVSFGCVTKGWVSHAEGNRLCARLLIAIRNTMLKGVYIPSWLELLSRIASEYLSYAGEAKDEADALIAFGRRRCQSFLAASQNSLPLAFNLCRAEVFIKLLQGSETKIRWLRDRFDQSKEHHGEKGLDFADAVILYKPAQCEYHSLVPMAIFDEENHNHPKHPDSSIPLYPFDEVREWASLFPVFMDETGHSSHRRWLPGFPSGGVRHGFGHKHDPALPSSPKRDPPASGYYRIATCAAERSFDIELSTGEPCTLFVDEPIWDDEEADWNFFGKDNHVTWMISPRSSLSTRPIQGSFLTSSPLSSASTERILGPRPDSIQSQIETEMRLQEYPVESRKLPPAPPHYQERPLHPRSVQFQLESGIQSYQSSVESRKFPCGPQSRIADTWHALLGAIMPFSSFTQEREILLTQEVERISEIYRQRLCAMSNDKDGVPKGEPGGKTMPRASAGKGPTGNQATAGEPPRTSFEATEAGCLNASHENLKTQESRPVWNCEMSNFDCLQGWYLQADTEASNAHLTKIFGDTDSVAIYTLRHRDSHSDSETAVPQYPALADPDVQRLSDNIPSLTINEVTEALERGQLDALALSRYLLSGDSEFWTTDYRKHLASLEALYSAATIYSNIPDASVDLSVTGRPFHDYQWVAHGPSNLAHARSFSCIATLESGHLNISPDTLAGVMGISTGNSLYIAQFLWSDPYSPPSSSIIRRSIGNVGKPGMAFLISPLNPKMKDPGYGSWKSVPHLDFDGNFEGNFGDTSVHLSFTGYEQALDIGEYGHFDREVYFLEAIVQVYETGSWVADLDILTALNGEIGRRYLNRVPERETCRLCSHGEEDASDFSQLGPTTSIDSWIELLDQPNNACIVRARGNWLARLTAAVLGVQKLKPVVIASRNVCWACLRDMDLNFSTTIIVC